MLLAHINCSQAIYSSNSDITIDLHTTELPTEMCGASPVRDTAEKVDLLMRCLAIAIHYSRSVVDKGGFYGNKKQEMNEYQNGVKGVVSLRKLKAMYKEKLIRLWSSNF
jgi:hypothetical protein